MQNNETNMFQLSDNRKVVAMNQLMKEQLQLHFGENYSTMVTDAKRAVTRICQQYNWFGHNLLYMMSSEGNTEGMLTSLLSYIIEVDDFEEGCTAYLSHLNHEFSPKRNLLLGDLDIGMLNVVEDDLAFGPSPSDATSKFAQNLGELVKTQEERDLAQTVADLGHRGKRGRSRDALLEAAQMLGVSHADAKKIWKRIYWRRTRLLERLQDA